MYATQGITWKIEQMWSVFFGRLLCYLLGLPWYLFFIFIIKGILTNTCGRVKKIQQSEPALTSHFKRRDYHHGRARAQQSPSISSFKQSESQHPDSHISKHLTVHYDMSKAILDVGHASKYIPLFTQTRELQGKCIHGLLSYLKTF